MLPFWNLYSPAYLKQYLLVITLYSTHFVIQQCTWSSFWQRRWLLQSKSPPSHQSQTLILEIRMRELKVRKKIVEKHFCTCTIIVRTVLPGHESNGGWEGVAGNLGQLSYWCCSVRLLHPPLSTPLLCPPTTGSMRAWKSNVKVRVGSRAKEARKVGGANSTEWF